MKMNNNLHNKVEQLILEGSVNRASILSLIFSIGFALYGLSSFHFINHFKPSVTLWQNLYPRILFNSIPLLIMALFLRAPRIPTKYKLWSWIIGMPTIFLFTTFIYVKPIILSGTPSIFLHVHCGNIIVFSMIILFVALPPKQMLIMLLLLFSTTLSPLSEFLKPGNELILNTYVNDSLLFGVVLLFGGYFYYQIPVKLTEQDLQEQDRLKNEIVSRDLEIQKKTLEALNLEITASLGKIAAQIAHDIRSPLAALSAISCNLPEVEEEKRLIISQSAQRINDIANTLLTKHRSVQYSDGSIPNQTQILPVTTLGRQPVLLSSLIDSVLTEKRTQYQGKRGIQINANLNEQSYTLFTEFDEMELKRIVSNLLDNAVESITEQGTTTVTLYEEATKACIAFTDSGVGIQADIVPKLGTNGGTYNKKHGTGLGLYHAKTTVEGWGGLLKIQSAVDKGTTVTLELPRCNTPAIG